MNVKIIKTAILNCNNVVLHLSVFQIFTLRGTLRGFLPKLHKPYEKEIEKAKHDCNSLDKEQLKTKNQALETFDNLLTSLQNGKTTILLKTKSCTYRLKKFMLIKIENENN